MNNMRNKILSLLVLLLTAATGAWAQGAFSSDPYTSTREFNSVSVKSSMTLNINQGVIVTVNSGLTIEDGVTLTLTGGGRLSVFGKRGDWGMDATYEDGTLIDEATAGGDGKPAIILNGNAKIVIDNGEIYAEGGQGGFGGTDEIAGINQPDGAAGNAFSRFPTIDGATLYYKSSNEWFKYTSGDQTLYNKMKAVPATFEVTINDTKTEAWFNMPAFDATAEYELVRDMTVDVAATIADRIRIKKENNDYVAVTATELIPAVSDKISGTAVAMTATTDYTAQLQKKTEGDTPTWADATTLSVGTFRYVITGTGLYDGKITTNEFQLFEGYEVTIPAGEYATYFKDEALYVENENAQLYTISSVTESEAVLSDAITVAPANTPLLVYNKSQTETLTFLLIPTTDKTPDNVTAATQFVGTLEATTIPASTTGADNYALNGYAFVWVKTAIEVGANKCWLHIASQPAGARGNTRSITGGNGTTGIESIHNSQSTLDNEGWYDLNGRKLQSAPNRKGIYIHNGKKVVMK